MHVLFRFYSSEHIRYVHAAAKAAVLSAVTVDADVHMPRARFGSVHPHAQLVFVINKSFAIRSH